MIVKKKFFFSEILKRSSPMRDWAINALDFLEDMNSINQEERNKLARYGQLGLIFVFEDGKISVLEYAGFNEWGLQKSGSDSQAAIWNQPSFAEEEVSEEMLESAFLADGYEF